MSSKSVMGAPRKRTDVFENLQRAAPAISEAPETQIPQSPVEATLAAQPAPTKQAPEQTPAQHAVPAARKSSSESEVAVVDRSKPAPINMSSVMALRVQKEPMIQLPARIPVSLNDAITAITVLTGISKTNLVTEAVRREVARLKEIYNIE